MVVVVALGALARFLEQEVPLWAAGTPFAKVAKSIEFPIYAIALGLIGNAVLTRLALRDALSKGFRTEFFIKTGLVLLGASINLKVLVTAAGPAIIQALLLISIVFGFTWWLGGLLGLDDKLRALLASAVSICGVSAAIAAAGAVQAKTRTTRLCRVAGDRVRAAVDLPAAVALRRVRSVGRGGGRLDRRQHRHHGRRRGVRRDRGRERAADRDNRQDDTERTDRRRGDRADRLFRAQGRAPQSPRKRGRRSGQFWERFPKFVLGFIAASIIGTLYLQVGQRR